MNAQWYTKLIRINGRVDISEASLINWNECWYSARTGLPHPTNESWCISQKYHWSTKKINPSLRDCSKTCSPTHPIRVDTIPVLNPHPANTSMPHSCIKC